MCIKTIWTQNDYLSARVKRINDTSTIWLQEGVVRTTGSFAHLHLKYNLAPLQRRIHFVKGLKTQFNQLGNTNHPAWTTGRRGRPKQEIIRDKKRFYFLQAFLNSTVDEMSSRMREVLHSYNSSHTLHKTLADSFEVDVHNMPKRVVETHKPKHRGKRQLIAATIGIIGGTLGGIISSQFGSGTITSVLEQKQDVIAHSVRSNIIKINQEEEDIRMLNKTMTSMRKSIIKGIYAREDLSFDTNILRTTVVARMVVNRINRIAQSVHAAQRGFLDLDSVDTTGLQEALTELAKETFHKGFELISSRVSDLQNMDTSYVINDESINLIIHVPVSRPDSAMDLYRFIPSPIITDIKKDPKVYMEVEPEQHWLAISRDRATYLALSNTEMESCSRQDSQRFCPHMARFKTGARNCLYSLYNNKMSDISNTCQATFTTSAFRTERLDISTWLVSMSTPDELIIQCPNQRPVRTTIEGNNLIFLDPGCSANTASLSIIRPKFEADNTVRSYMTSQPELRADLWFESHKAHVDAAVADLLTHVGQRIPASEVKRAIEFQRKLDSIHASGTGINWLFTSMHTLANTAITVVIICLTAMLGWRIFKCAFRYRRGREFPGIVAYHRAAISERVPPCMDENVKTTIHDNILRNTNVPDSTMVQQDPITSADSSATANPTESSTTARPSLPFSSSIFGTT